MTTYNTQHPVLKPEDHAFFLEHGYVVLKGLVPQALVQAAVRDLESGTYQGNVGNANYHPVRAESVDACVTDTVLDAIGELFGDAYPYDRHRGAADMPRPYEPDTQWSMQGVHVDDDYPTPMPGGWAIGMFIFLTPVRSHGGAFTYVDGSPYRLRSISMDNPDWIKFCAQQTDVVGSWKEFLAEPGDVLLFHHLMAHAGSNNVSDPQTRHALLSRYHPERRIVPGDKPFDEMTTIEKANSTRYLNHPYGAQHPLPELGADERTSEVLQKGLEPSERITASAILRHAGVTHLFFVDGAAPNTIRRLCTRNWVDWEQAESLEVQNRVNSLTLFGSNDVHLFVGVDGDNPQTLVLVSGNLRQWTELGVVPNSRFGAGFYTTNFGSKIASGKVVLHASPSDPRMIRARWEKEWGNWDSRHYHFAEWSNEADVIGVPCEHEVAHCFVRPIFGESEFALFADLKHDEGSSRPYYTLSRDSVCYQDGLKPVDYTMSTTPRQLSVYARARRYWLLTYIRNVDGVDRMFWGAIDWEAAPGRLDELSSTEALAEALKIVGLI